MGVFSCRNGGRYLVLFVAALLLPIVFLLLVTEHPLSLDDGLRHITIARQYSERGVGGVNGWGDELFAGYFSQHNSDPWFLADLAYVPFTVLRTSTIGLKVATFVFLLFFLLCFFPFLRSYRCSQKLTCIVLILLLFGSPIFLFRALLGRPFVIVTGIFLLTELLIVQEHVVLLLPLLAFATLFSHLFVFPFVLALSGAAWFLLRGRTIQALRCTVFSSSGVLLGFFLHPQGAAYARYFRDVFLRIPFSKELGVASEIRSGFGFAEVPVFLLIAALFLLAVALQRRNALRSVLQKRPEIFLTLFLFSMFFVAFALWVRAIDLLWPLGILLFLQIMTADAALEMEVMRSTWWRLVLFLCALNFLSVATIFLKGDAARSPEAYAAIEAVPRGSHVLNADWEIFPVLFSLNSSVQYARAMDPSFDYYADPENFAILDRTRDRGFVAKANGDIDAAAWIADVRSHFQADYLVLRKDHHPKLLSKLRAFPDLPLFAESRALVIFAL